MEVVQVLHMNKGAGETSYAMNSTVQSKIISITNLATQEAIVQTLLSSCPKSMGIADLGCSSGAVTSVLRCQNRGSRVAQKAWGLRTWVALLDAATADGGAGKKGTGEDEIGNRNEDVATADGGAGSNLLLPLTLRLHPPCELSIIHLGANL